MPAAGRESGFSKRLCDSSVSFGLNQDTGVVRVSTEVVLLMPFLLVTLIGQNRSINRYFTYYEFPMGRSRRTVLGYFVGPLLAYLGFLALFVEGALGGSEVCFLQEDIACNCCEILNHCFPDQNNLGNLKNDKFLGTTPEHPDKWICGVAPRVTYFKSFPSVDNGIQILEQLSP